MQFSCCLFLNKTPTSPSLSSLYPTQRRAVIVFCGSENDGKQYSACMALYDNYENVERAGDKKPKKVIYLLGAKIEEPTYSSPVGSQGSPGSGGTPLEKACQFLVIHSNEVNEFRSESGDMKVHWLKLLTLLTMFPYSVIPEEPSANPISEGFRYKLDPKSYGAGMPLHRLRLMCVCGLCVLFYCVGC